MQECGGGTQNKIVQVNVVALLLKTVQVSVVVLPLKTVQVNAVVMLSMTSVVYVVEKTIRLNVMI